jgi:tRNA(Ile)-lysidine synthase TilS/MesJ
MPAVATTPELYRFLTEGCPVAIGVSGGKDSAAVAIATNNYLNAIDHKGPRILIHADLGVTEWKASLPIPGRHDGPLGAAVVR